MRLEPRRGADRQIPRSCCVPDIAEGLAAGDSANALAKRLAQKYSRKKRDVYNLVLAVQVKSE
ncbi:MAG: hypothetical protein ACLTSX_09830 [Collinsella sp.]